MIFTSTFDLLIIYSKEYLLRGGTVAAAPDQKVKIAYFVFDIS
jgi:hypothetical protein